MLASSTRDRARPVLPGLQLKGDAIAGRYRVDKLLGAGSSGFVVQAHHVYLRRRVTLKILTSVTKAQERAQRRCLAAAHVAATLRGPHVARVLDTGFTEEGMPFVATEHLEGRTLLEEMKERGALSVPEAVRWVLQACEALAEAHANGIVHGDLKPQNLFLASDGIKVLDFGMSNAWGDGSDEDEGTFATWFTSPVYVAPEQLQSTDGLDPRADVWSLGVILHELVAGTLPFHADSVSGMLVAVVHDDPTSLTGEGVPEGLAEVVRTCLAKHPDERFASVPALAEALAPFAGPEGPELAARVARAAKPAEPIAPSEAQGPAADDSDTFGISRGPAAATFRKRTLADDDRPSRRRATFAKIAAVLVLVVVAIATAPASGTGTELVEPPLVPREELTPLPFVPHSFDLERHPPGAERHHPGPRPLEPARAPQAQRPPASPARAAKPRLAVRENPYVTGSTHPSRDRRK